MARSGDAARTALLDAAERLFAEHGLHGVSLRDVSAATGQRNHSAAQYHFGDRTGLLVAVFERRMVAINERRLELIAAAEAAGCERELATLVDIGIRPLVEYVCAHDGWYGRFQLRVRTERDAADAIREHPMRAGYLTNSRRLQRELETLPKAVRLHRGEQVLDLAITASARWEWARDRHEPRLPAEDLAAELVSTGVAMLQAPALIGASR